MGVGAPPFRQVEFQRSQRHGGTNPALSVPKGHEDAQPAASPPSICKQRPKGERTMTIKCTVTVIEVVGDRLGAFPQNSLNLCPSNIEFRSNVCFLKHLLHFAFLTTIQEMKRSTSITR